MRHLIPLYSRSLGSYILLFTIFALFTLESKRKWAFGLYWHCFDTCPNIGQTMRGVTGQLTDVTSGSYMASH